ncbi:MAG: hypothetical protein ACOCUU_03500 [Nanoarchaeota archaeon]
MGRIWEYTKSEKEKNQDHLEEALRECKKRLKKLKKISKKEI